MGAGVKVGAGVTTGVKVGSGCNDGAVGCASAWSTVTDAGVFVGVGVAAALLSAAGLRNRLPAHAATANTTTRAMSQMGRWEWSRSEER